MDNQELMALQGQIGYTFSNTDLLKQVITEKPCMEEAVDPDAGVLLDLGKNALDICAMRYLIEKYSRTEPDDNGRTRFHSKYGKEELLELRDNLVEVPALSTRISELGLNRFMTPNGREESEDLADAESASANLFMALFGAAVIDSGWNYDTIQSTMEIMLNPDSFFDDGTTDYVRMIQEWEERRNREIPWFTYYDRPYSADSRLSFEGVRQNFPASAYTDDLNYTCELKILDSVPLFRAYGESKNAARMQVCKVAIDWLSHHGLLYSIQDEIRNPNVEEAIEQLQLLAHRGYFSHPRFSLSSEEETGNQMWSFNSFAGRGKPSATLQSSEARSQMWKAVCHVDGKQDFAACGDSIREAKKLAAYKMLMHVLGLSED